MKKQALLFFAVLIFSACTDENFIRLEVNPAVKELVPNYSKAKKFASNEGDTIEIRQISSSRYYEKVSSEVGNLGALGETDYVEAERLQLVIGSDTPYFRFYFYMQALYSNQSERFSNDELQVSFDDFEGKADAHLTFRYTDTLLCVSERCEFTDTLKLLDKNFIGTYFTSRDSLSRKAIYLNAQKGLVGFRGDKNKIFELID